MSIIEAVQSRVSRDRLKPPFGKTPIAARFEKPARDLRTSVRTEDTALGSIVGFTVVTDRGTFFAAPYRRGMVRVVTTHESKAARAWFWDDRLQRGDWRATLIGRITGTYPTGGWRAMTRV